MVELLRERLYAFALGFSRRDDADRLAHDPAFKTAAWDRPGCGVADERLASRPTSSRLVSLLAGSHNGETPRQFLYEPVLRHRRARGGRINLTASEGGPRIHRRTPRIPESQMG
jgi:hypothetical protein